jgi:ERCC4-type nuclease
VDSREKKRIRDICNLCCIKYESAALPFGDFALSLKDPDPDSKPYIAGVEKLSAAEFVHFVHISRIREMEMLFGLTGEKSLQLHSLCNITITQDDEAKLLPYTCKKDMITAGAERKTFIDYIQSVQRGRIFHQANGLSDYYEIPILAIVGSRQAAIEKLLNDAHVKVNENVINGALASIFVRRSPHILWFENDVDMLKHMHEIFDKINDGKWQIPFSDKPKRDNTPTDALMLVPGITKMVAYKLLSKYGTIEKISAVPLKEMQATCGHIVGQNVKEFLSNTGLIITKK